MEFLEKNLEDIIYNVPNEIIKSRGLRINGRKKRQVRIGNYGIADIVTVSRYFDPSMTSPSIIFTIYELKQNVVNTETFFQALRYAQGIRHYLRDRNIYQENEVLFNICLVGREVDLKGSLCYAPNIFSNVSIYTYKYDYDGITFVDESGYLLNNCGWDKLTIKDPF